MSWKQKGKRTARDLTLQNSLLSRVDVPQFAEDIGLDNVQTVSHCVRSSCPFPENHRNDDKNRSFSIMRDGSGRYNCFVCFSPDTLVSTGIGYKPISSISSGDLVWARNKALQVNTLIKTPYKGEMLEVILNGCSVPFKVTPTHKFKTSSGMVPIKDLSVNDTVMLDLPTPFKSHRSIPDLSLNVYGSRGPVPVIPDLRRLSDLEISYLFGLFYAEGHARRGLIVFTLNINDPFKHCLLDLMRKIWNNITVLDRPEKNVSELFLSSTALSNFCRSNCYNTFSEKVIPPFIYTLSKKAQKQFVQGVIDGDGNIVDAIKTDKKGCTYRNRSMRIKTSSKEGAFQLRDLCANLGYRLGISYNKAYDNHKESFSLIFSNYYIDTWISGKLLVPIKTLVYPISRKTSFVYSGNVYNLNVKDIHEYSTFSATVSNCGNGNLIGLLMRIKKMSEKDALEWIRAYTDSSLADVVGKIFGDEQEEYLKPKFMFTEAQLEAVKYNYSSYAKKRGVIKKIYKKFELGYARKTKTLYFPVKDFYGNLQGLVVRKTDKKIYVCETGFEKSSWLYGLEHAKLEEHVIIVEGMFDVLKLVSMGYNAIGTFGAIMSDVQAELVIDNFTSVTYIRDRDDAGKAGKKKAFELVGAKLPFYATKLVKGRKDVGDMTEREIKAVIKSKYIYVGAKI